MCCAARADGPFVAALTAHELLKLQLSDDVKILLEQVWASAERKK